MADTKPVKYGTGDDEYNSRRWLAERGYQVGKGAQAAGGGKLIPWLDIASRMGIDTSQLPKDPKRWPEGLMQDVQNALYGWGVAGQSSGNYANALRANLESDTSFGQVPTPKPAGNPDKILAGKYELTPATIHPLGPPKPAPPPPAPGPGLFSPPNPAPTGGGGIITGAADVTKPKPQPMPGPTKPAQKSFLGQMPTNPTQFAQPSPQPKPRQRQFTMGGLFQ